MTTTSYVSMAFTNSDEITNALAPLPSGIGFVVERSSRSWDADEVKLRGNSAAKTLASDARERCEVPLRRSAHAFSQHRPEVPLLEYFY